MKLATNICVCVHMWCMCVYICVYAGVHRCVESRTVHRFRVTRNSSNEILDSGKITRTRYSNSGNEILDSGNLLGTRIRVPRDSKSGLKREKICFFHILPKFVRILGWNWRKKLEISQKKVFTLKTRNFEYQKKLAENPKFRVPEKITRNSGFG